MKILKHGDLKERKFVCKDCGCEFVANCNEYRLSNFDAIEMYCPECNTCFLVHETNAPLYKPKFMPMDCQSCGHKKECIDAIDSKDTIKCIDFGNLKKWRETNNER